ncbi:hypothetical protein [Xanthobacter sp. KR7-65]|uniref:hypothetical protein n=2 Tax=Xanthobacteraceae TaxID=335928 RepID=UPI0032B43E79
MIVNEKSQTIKNILVREYFMKKIPVAIFVFIVICGSYIDSSFAEVGQSTNPTPADLRGQAVSHLKFMYGMYFAIRGCSEAYNAQAEPNFKPTITLAEAQQVLRAADAAARSVGIDVDKAWLEMSSIGQAAGEALKMKTDDNYKKCQQSGMFFRTITSRLQMTIRKLDGNIHIIEKDY